MDHVRHQEEYWSQFWNGVQDVELDWTPMDNAVLGAILQATGNLKGKKILEAGCGTGKISSVMAREGANMTLLDLTAEALALAQQVFGHQDLTADFIRGNMMEMPFADNTFDVVWNAGVMEHFEHDQHVQTLKEFRRVLKPDGIIVSINPNAKSMFYRMGKYWAEQYGVWTVYEKPIVSLADAVKESDLQLVDEFHTAFESSCLFLGNVSETWDTITPIVMQWWNSLEEDEKKFFPGYLLATVATK